MVFDQETHTVDNRQTVTACRFAEHAQCEERIMKPPISRPMPFTVSDTATAFSPPKMA